MILIIVLMYKSKKVKNILYLMRLHNFVKIINDDLSTKKTLNTHFFHNFQWCQRYGFIVFQISHV